MFPKKEETSLSSLVKQKKEIDKKPQQAIKETDPPIKPTEISDEKSETFNLHMDQ